MGRVLKFGCLGIVGLVGLLVVGFVAIAIFAPPPTDKEMRQLDKQLEGEKQPQQPQEAQGGAEDANIAEDAAYQQPAQPASPAVPEGLRISRVVDGDTLEISEAVECADTVRLIGVDAPEEGGPCGEQPLAQDAAWFMDTYEGERVRLEFDEDLKDQYGRLLAYTYVDSFGTKFMLNEELLLEGLAQVYIVEPNDRYEERFLEAQKKAQDELFNIISIWQLTKAEKRQLADHGNGVGTENLEEGACPSTTSPTATASPSPAPGDGDPDRDRGIPAPSSPSPAPSPKPGACEPPAYPVPPGDERDGDGDGCAGEV